MLKRFKKDMVDAAKLAGSLYAGCAIAYTTVKIIYVIVTMIF